MPILTQGRHKCSMCKHDMHGAAFCGQNHSDIISSLTGEAAKANPSSSATICNLCYITHIKDELRAQELAAIQARIRQAQDMATDAAVASATQGGAKRRRDLMRRIQALP